MQEFTVTQSNTINFAPSTEVEEVLQNVATLLGTFRYTVPYDRTLGIDASFVDTPTPVTEARLQAEVINLIREREPRAQVVNVKFKRDNLNASLVPTVRIAINV